MTCNGDNTAKISVKGGERALGLVSSDLPEGSESDTISISTNADGVIGYGNTNAGSYLNSYSDIYRYNHSNYHNNGIHHATGMDIANQAAKATMTTNLKANTQIKANQIGTMNTQGPIALAYRLVLTIAPLMQAMETTTLTSWQLVES